jgi:hypothetical protein
MCRKEGSPYRPIRGLPPLLGDTRSGKPPVLEPIPADLERVRDCFVAAAEG